MKFLIILFLSSLISSSSLAKEALFNKISDSLNQEQLQKIVFWILFQNNGDELISVNQARQINKWKNIKAQFIVIISNLTDIYQKDSNRDKNFSDFDFQSQKVLFELIMNFVIKLYKDNHSIHPLSYTIIEEYFIRKGFNLSYPYWFDANEIYRIIYSFNFYYDDIFKEINDFKKESSFANFALQLDHYSINQFEFYYY